MMSSVEDVAEHQRKEDEWQEKRRALRAAVTQGGLLHMMGQAVENPHSGLAGKVFAFLSVIMEKCSQKCRNMFVVESVCVIWFTLEFLARFFHAQSKLDFACNPLAAGSNPASHEGSADPVCDAAGPSLSGCTDSGAYHPAKY
ncbi:Potassium voltage-gated channel subfamily G member 1 Voltage-gated potassium channel subunit Kv6.1 [Channa argus]|uniref:Potassium voltage-gated channel subfamily G member 1 Voltage-gated potassium channel subunit Kv6.1 n=1 Tax=Channa argus TaxID=215402 RepID=A0A6G1PMK4_CHAAH|nr:Potassium voltage-gated channel subfamily G member 1 Voltage-gated potassium channel subunit Kv6.1 [Channa argus]